MNTEVTDAIKKQEQIIKTHRSRIVNEFSTLPAQELGALKNGIELAQTRIKNLKNGSLSPSAIN